MTKRTDAKPALQLAGALDYSPAPESCPALIKSRYGHFIGGEFVDGDDHFTTVNPATGDVLAEVAAADDATVDQAVEAPVEGGKVDDVVASVAGTPVGREPVKPVTKPV